MAEFQKQVNPGDLVRDKLSGFEGVVTHTASWEFNCDRASVKPVALKDGSIPCSESFDIPQLEVIKAGYIDLGVVPEEPRFSYGDFVCDKLSPFRGVVFGYGRYLNGCLRIAVQSSELHEGKPVDELWFPQGQLELIKKEETSKPTVRTGGPMPEPKGPSMPS